MLATLLATCSLLALGLEGLVCVLMALPLALPLGALGGWLAYKMSFSRVATSGVAMVLLLPSASLTWDAEYWRWWSDAIIHRIHSRVLKHIRTLAEGEIETAGLDSHGYHR